MHAAAGRRRAHGHAGGHRRADPVTASAGQRATTFVTWDGTDQFRMRVPADAYVLLLEFESNDGGSTRTVRATATLQMND